MCRLYANTTLYYIKDLNIIGFWYLRAGLGTNPPTDTEGWLYIYTAFLKAAWHCTILQLLSLLTAAYRISIDKIMLCSEKTTKSQWHTKINICLVYRFAGVQLIWASLAALCWARFCPCSQLWLAEPILTCSYVWDWLVIGSSRMVPTGKTRAIPLSAKWVILQEAGEFWKRPQLGAAVHFEFRLDMLNWITLGYSRGGFEKLGYAFQRTSLGWSY